MRTACCEPVAMQRGMRPALKGAGVSAPWLLLLVPKFGCPLCWPLLAGALGTFGLGHGAWNNLSIVAATVALAVVVLRWVMVPRKRLEMTWLGVSLSAALAYGLLGTPAAIALLSVVLLIAVTIPVFRSRRRTRQNAGVCAISTHVLTLQSSSRRTL
jgi:hypothetical protein